VKKVERASRGGSVKKQRAEENSGGVRGRAENRGKLESLLTPSR
jgi:hypothetical protein